jgi:hypothetical protein
VYDETAAEYVPDSLDPIAKTLAALAGGASAFGLEQMAEGAVGGLANAARNATLGRADPNAPIDPKTGEKTGWKPVTSDLMGGLGAGAAAAAGGAQPVAGAQPAATEQKVVFQGRSQGGRNYRRYNDGTVEYY